MAVITATAFENYLDTHDAAHWAQTLAELIPSIHEVDRNATRIWFAFYPLTLRLALEAADSPEALAKKLLIEGDYRLENRIDTSHHFFYGHRYWAEAKRAVTAYAGNANGASSAKLADVIRQINRTTAITANADETLTLGITTVAVMTLQQVGAEAFAATAGTVKLDRAQLQKSPDQILRERARDDGQGLFGFLKTEDKRWTVTFDEGAPDHKFKCVNGEELASGAARDTRDWSAEDERRKEGAIPVQCRSAACGTCWVGVLGGEEKLSPVNRLEGTKIKEFGYINTNEAQPVIRLACMAQAHGAISIVIPPWNGFFGKYLASRENQKS